MSFSGVTWAFILIRLKQTNHVNDLHTAAKMIWFLTFGLTYSPKKNSVMPWCIGYQTQMQKIKNAYIFGGKWKESTSGTYT